MFINKKYTCGEIFPSGCVPYTGELPSFIPPESVSCDANVDEIIENIGAKIDEILENSDLTSLFSECFEFDAGTITIKDFEQIQLDKICEHEVEIAAIQDELNNFDAESIVFDFDFGDCITAPDESGSYSLILILETLRDAICELVEDVETCCSTPSGTSGTSGASGTSGTSGTSGGNGTSGTSGTSGTCGTSGS